MIYDMSIYFTALFITAAILAIGLFLCKLILDAFKYFVEKSTKPKYHTATLRHINNDNRKELIGEYLQNERDLNFKQQYFHGNFIYEELIRHLEEYYAVSIVRQLCSDENWCRDTIKLVGKSGSTFYIGYNMSNGAVRNTEGKYYHKSSNFDLNSYLVDEFSIKMITSIDAIRSKTIEDDHEDMVELRRILDLSQLHPIKSEYEPEKSTKVFRFIKHPVRGYQLVNSIQPVATLSKKEIDLMYSNLNIEFDNVNYLRPAGDAVRIATESVMLGQNIFFTGPPGTGKTTLMHQIGARLSRKPKTRVIMVTPAILQELSTAEAQGALLAVFGDDTLEGFVNIFLVDEAENLLQRGEKGIHSMDNTFLLQLLDGDIGKQLNLRMILTFNAEPHQLNEKLFREGRMGMMFDMKPLPKEQAIKVVDMLKLKFIDKEFSQPKFDKVVREVNKLPGDIEYCATNEITLADIFGCFMDRSKKALIREILGIKEKIPFSLPEVKVRPNVRELLKIEEVTESSVDVPISEAKEDPIPIPSRPNPSKNQSLGDKIRREKERRRNKNK